jgi:hypothetical protein
MRKGRTNMAYLVETKTGEAVLTAATTDPFGPRFTAEQAEGADKMEVWGSSFADPGPDWCEFRLFKAGEQVATKRTEGY